MIRTAPRCFAPQFASPSPSIASSDDADALPAPCIDGPLLGSDAGTMYGTAKRSVLGRYGNNPSHVKGPSHSGPLLPTNPGLLPRSHSQPKPAIQDLNLAFAAGNESEDESDDGTVLDAPVVSPGTAARTGVPLHRKAAEKPAFRGRASSTGGGQGSILVAAVIEAPSVYPFGHYKDDAPAPSPATLAIAAAAAEMRSHEHRTTRYRHPSGGFRRGEEGAPGPRAMNKSRSKEFTGQGIRVTASSHVLESRPSSAALSTKSSSMPSQSLEDVGSPSLEEQALAICQGLPEHSIQSAPSKVTKPLTVHIAKDDDEEEEEAYVQAHNPWDITATSTPCSEASELYPLSTADIVSPAPVVSSLFLAPPPKGGGAILVAAPVNPALVKRSSMLRSASEDRRPSAARPDALYQEEKGGSGPSSLDNSPAHPSCMPKANAVGRRLSQGANGSAVKSRGAERLKSQLGRLALGSNSASTSPAPNQKHARVPMKLPSSDSYDGAKAPASRNLRDLYPIQGAPTGTMRQGAGGVVRNARSLSPAAWKRNFPALDIPFNSADSPRSPPKPIAVAAPSTQGQLRGRRR